MKRDLALAAVALALVGAALVPLHRVFTATTWLPEMALAGGAAVILAAILRRIRLPGAVTLVASLALLGVVAAQLYAAEHGPWPGVAALGELLEHLRAAATILRNEPAPIDPVVEVRLLLFLATWTIGHITHELLVRIQRVGAALLVAGLLWFAPLVVPLPDAVAWTSALPFFVVAGLALLLEPSPDSLGWTREETNPSLPPGGVAVVGVAATIGLLAPWLSPGFEQPAWVDVTSGAEPRGYQPIVDVTERLRLPEPRDVLEVRSPQQVYLRIAALDSYDGRTWRLGPADVDTFRPDPDQLFRATGPLPFETPIATGTDIRLDVEVLDLENIYVPVPYQVAQISGPDNVGMFYSRQGGFVATGEIEDRSQLGEARVGVRPGLTYSLDAVVPTPSYADLAGMGDIALPAGDALVGLPGGYDDFAALTRAIAEDAGATTSIDVALAVQEYFIGANSTFVYSTEVPEPRGDQALRDFLFDHQVGYCEHYAAAMAVMLRSVGIPARVAVGFLPGAVVEEADGPGQPATFRVSTTDAHAWVEVLFEGSGWVRFDPTPRGDGLPASADNLAPLPPAAPEPDPIEPTEQQTQTPQPPDQPAPPDEQQRPDELIDDVPGTAPDQTPAAVRGLVATVIVLLVLAIVLAIVILTPPRLRHRLARRRPDPIDDVVAAQRRVLATAAELGIGRRPSETVTEAAVRWAHTGMADPDDATTFARLGGQAAFGMDVDADDADRMHEVEHRLVAGFTKAVDTSQQLTAPWRHAGTRLLESVSRRAD
jgi:transglutaminase-like putative cysteine protease